MSASATFMNMDEAIRHALNSVMDPCSVNAGAPISVLDMGMIVGWSVDAAHNVQVGLRLTSPGCTLAPSFMVEIENALMKIPEIGSCKVKVTGHTLWSEQDIETSARQRLAARRELSRVNVPVRPQQWRNQAVH